MAENVGGIYIDIELESAQLLDGAKKVNEALSGMGSSAGKASGNFDGVGKSANNAGKSIARSADDASQAAKMMDRLGNEIAILEEANEKGARSAVVLAAQLRAGSTATAAQVKEIGDLAGKLYDMKTAQDQATKSTDKATVSSGKMEMVLSRLALSIAGAFTLQAAKRVIDIADQMSVLQSRIERLSPSIEAAKATMSSLSSIASQTGSSLQDTEKLWEKLTLSLKSAGVTNGQLLSLTDTLQKIGVIGGSSAEEMSNALRQFGQSVDGGVIRAQEFNSILEQMPELSRQMAAGLGLSVGELRKRMLEGKLTAEDALNAVMSQAGKVNEQFDKMPASVERSKNSLDVAFKNVIADLNDSIGLTKELAGWMTSLSNNLNYFNKNVGDAGRLPKLLDLQKQYTQEVKEGQKWWETQTNYQQRVGAAAFNLKNTEAEIRSIRAASTKELQNQGKITIPKPISDSKEAKNLERNSQRRLELSKLEGEAKARLQAQYDAEDAGITDSKRIKDLQDRYAATQKNTAATKEGNAEAKKSASQAESIAQKLANLKQQSELAGDSTRQLSRDQAILTAQQSLGSAATKEDIALAGKYAAAKWDTGNAIRAQAAAEKLLPETKENASYNQDVMDLKTALDAKKITQQQYYQISEKLEQDHQTKLAEIRANQAVTPQQDAAAKVDPVQQLANENARKLALIQQYEAAGTLAHDQAVALRNATDTQYEQQRIAAQWQIYRNQSVANELLASSIESFSSGASSAITGLINGTQSLSESFANLGTSVLNGVVSSLVQMGTQWVMSALMGQTAQQTAMAVTQASSTAALTATTLAGQAAASALLASWSPAAMAASIASYGGAATAGLTGYTTAMTTAQTMSIAGARKNGGPVSAGSMYQVGESGKPEIFKASNGSQYMIPGDNGSVISNKDLGSSASGGTAIQQTVQFNIQTTGGIDDSTMQKMTTMMKQVSLSTIKDQQRPSGLLSKTR